MARYWGAAAAAAWSGVQRKGVEQEQLELLLLLPAGAAARLWKGMSRRCLGYRIVPL
jgi:hypothetical protein